MLVSDPLLWFVAGALAFSIGGLLCAALGKLWFRIQYPIIAKTSVDRRLPADGRIELILPPDFVARSVLVQFRPASGFVRGSLKLIHEKDGAPLAEFCFPERKAFLQVTYQRDMLFTKKSLEFQLTDAMPGNLVLMFDLDSNLDDELAAILGRRFRMECIVFGKKHLR